MPHQSRGNLRKRAVQGFPAGPLLLAPGEPIRSMGIVLDSARAGGAVGDVYCPENEEYAQ